MHGPAAMQANYSGMLWLSLHLQIFRRRSFQVLKEDVSQTKPNQIQTVRIGTLLAETLNNPLMQ